jgi:hypothetical protein
VDSKKGCKFTSTNKQNTIIMKIQAKEIKVGNIIKLGDCVGNVLEIKESFQKNGKRLLSFLIDSPERIEKQRLMIGTMDVLVPAKKRFETCKETTKVTIY